VPGITIERIYVGKELKLKDESLNKGHEAQRE